MGEFQLGERVNRFRPGSLVMRLPDSELSGLPTLLYGTVEGSLGVLAALPLPLFEFLNKLQVRVRGCVGAWRVCACVCVRACL